MAMEIEYTDVDNDTEPNWDLTADDIDAADIVNGNGEHHAGVPDFNHGHKIKLMDADATNQDEDATTLDNDATEPEPELTDEEKAELRARAESLHAIELAAAKEEHFGLAVKRSDSENELKELKADEKAALKNLKNLIKRGPNYPREKSKIDAAVSSAVSGPSAIQVDDPDADQSWRDIPTSEIISGLKGMGKKKAEAIIDLAPSLGDLEELRAQAGLSFATFASVLPKGVGGALADEIEERIFTRMRKHTMERAAVDGGAEAAADDATEELDEGIEAELDAAEVE